jgi:Calcineurin-like phosphoesterase
VQPYVGPDGGKVNRLYFAIVGDTRPPASNDTAHYPSAIITKIYDEIQAMSPRPQFVITTGDYMFASPGGVQGAKQMKLYLEARDHYKGTVFAALGNHECGGDVNCAGVTNNNSYNAFLDGLVKPLGKTKPYYSIPISDISGKWNAKVVMVACNAWSAAQNTWLTGALAKPTTYTFIVRHQPMGSDAPCNDAMAPLLKTAKYDMLAVGHVHRYSHSGKQLIEGVGGAPLTGTFNHGYATVRQLDDGSLRVRQYDYKTKQVVGSFILP